MKNADTTITIAADLNWFKPGDVIEGIVNSGRRERYRVTEVCDTSTITVRNLRWYERLWYWLKGLPGRMRDFWQDR